MVSNAFEVHRGVEGLASALRAARAEPCLDRCFPVAGLLMCPRCRLLFYGERAQFALLEMLGHPDPSEYEL
jgi:hypothetical protein